MDDSYSVFDGHDVITLRVLSSDAPYEASPVGIRPGGRGDRRSRNALADRLPLPIMISDASGVVSFFNRSWHEYTGQPKFDTDRTHAWRAYLHPEDAERVADEWVRAVDARQDVIQVQYRVRQAATGEFRWFLARAVALRDDSGEITRWLSVAMDIEEERRAHAELGALYDEMQAVFSMFQRASLPPSLPQVDGFRFEALYLPAEGVNIGGDWYEALALPGGSRLPLVTSSVTESKRRP